MFPAFLMLPPPHSFAQEAEPTLKTHRPQISVNVREVVVDITVYDGNGYFSRGNPVRGLHKEDFEVLENGRPQTVRSFEEHTSPSTEQREATLEQTAPPAGERTATPPLSVILVDQASLGFEEQPFLLAELDRFLQGAPGDSPIAIFALTPNLRVVQGFTTDRAALLTAIHSKTFGIHPLPSPMLETDDENTLSTYAAASLRAAASQLSSTSATGMADQLDRLDAGRLATQAAERTANTLKSFQEIAHYLAALPGRKNLIWLGTTFTDRPFGLDTEPDPQFKRTADLLQLARVAVFPIDAAGLVAYGPGGVAVPLPGMTSAQSATAVLNQARLDKSLGRNAFHGTMDDIAERTGGEAYYNTNGLAWAMNRVVEGSAAYYSVTYSSNDREAHSGYSKIQVRLKNRHPLWRLSYRRGYFVDDALAVRRDAVEPVALEPFMDPGMPTMSQLTLKMATRRSEQTLEPGEPFAGQNRKLRGPATRFNFNLELSPGDLAFSKDSEGHADADLVLDLVAYNDRGDLVNWLSRRFSPSLDPAKYLQSQQIGLQLDEMLDLPPGKYLVRVGVYDLHSGKVGTLDKMFHVEQWPALSEGAAKP